MYWHYKILLVISAVILVLISITGLFLGGEESLVDNQQQKEKVPPKAINHIIPEEPIQKANIQNLFREAKNFSSQNQYEQALSIYEKISKSTDDFSDDWFKSVEALSKINSKFLNSNTRSKRKISYLIAFGDDLFNIAKKYYTTSAAIKKANNIKDGSRIFAGQTVFFFDGPWKIVIYKERKQLLLYNKGKIFKLYPIGVGKENKTPEGKFTIYGKVTNPYWEPLGRRRIPPGDPKNVLGTRWMKIIEPTGQFQGYGIHGTTEPESIGKASSQGCVRMHNADVEEIFDLVPEKTKVVILP